jgi:alanine dehydrogenase
MTSAADAAAVLTVGVPAEVKNNENRVAITPDGVRELVLSGVPVMMQAGAGTSSSITDDEYRAAGARIVPDAEAVWAEADLVCKVKEPQPEEWPLMREGQVLFTYLHLAAYPEVAKELLARKVTGVAYETVQLENASLPLLAPMSEVAGRMATQVGAHFLERENGGRGVLLGGAPGVRPARVVVIGAGNVGWNAAWIAAGMEAEVVLLDKNLDRLRWVDQIHKGRIMTLASNRGSVERTVVEADLVVGAVLLPGGRAPIVVSDELVRGMKDRSVIVDVAIDQGGCVEGIRETTHDDPVFERHGVLHYAVGNIPGAVPHTSTYALTNATLPFLTAVASKGLRQACRDDPALALGVNTLGGAVTHPVVADALGVDPTPLDPLLA